MKLTPDQRCALESAWHCLCCGGLCSNSLAEMKELEALGLVKITPTPDEWPEAEYGYLMTDKGEEVAKETKEAR